MLMPCPIYLVTRPRYLPHPDLRHLPRIWLLDVSCLGGDARGNKLDLGSGFSTATKSFGMCCNTKLIVLWIQKVTADGDLR